MNRFRSLPRWLQVVVGTVAAVTICCCGLVGISLVIPSGDETPTVVVQGIDVGGRAPEVSVLDTETPTPAATNTPMPTATSTPRPTELPTKSPSATPPATDTPLPTAPLPTEPPPAEPTATPQLPTATDTPAPTTPPTAAPTQPPTVAPTQAPTSPPAAKVVIARVFNSGKQEYVEIVNQGGAAQDLSGWAVYGSKGDDRYTFPGGYVLGPGARVRLHSGDNGVNAPPGDIYWSDKPVWNNDGETVYLADAQGNLVHQYRY